MRSSSSCAALALCLLGLPSCVTVRSAAGSAQADHPMLLGPITAIGATAPAPLPPPAGEPIVLEHESESGSFAAGLGSVRWDKGNVESSEHMGRLKLSPGAPLRVRHYGCHAATIALIFVFDVQVWCTVKSDLAPPPAR